jgi:hypothetical protein
MKEQVAVLELESVAVQVTVVVPTGKQKPDAGEQTTVVGPGQFSVTVGLGYVTAIHLLPRVVV